MSIVYTKDNWKKEHIGLFVKTSAGVEGKLLGMENDGRLYFNVKDRERWGFSSSYTLLPMPLKEAYERGLLRVGQKVRYFRLESSYERRIEEIRFDGTWDEYGGLHEYSDDWLVEILEEPEEKPEEVKLWGKSLLENLPNIQFGVDLGLGKSMTSISLFSSMMKDVEEAADKMCLVPSQITNEPKKTLMSYLDKARKAAKDLFTPEDIKVMRDAGWENEPNVRSVEGTEALLDMLYADNRDKLVEKAKEIKKEIEAQSEKK